MNRYSFDACIFVKAGFETAAGEYDEETRIEIALLRQTYPELSHWGDLAIGVAWGDYSQEVEMISWRYWGLDQRDEDFLNYICWLQERGKWEWGDDYRKLAEACIWKTGGPIE